MGTLSFWKDFKGKDYKFLDDVIRQQFNIGGTGIYIHKYLGPHWQGDTGDATMNNSPNIDETTIQDVLLLENRDRKYDKDIIELKGHYTLADLDFNLTQFGLMLSGDTLYISFHINDMVERLGRKLIAGDVLELVHKREDLFLDEAQPAINAFYVIKEANRSSEGYSQTWLPHIWRVKVEPITDSQAYKDIMKKEQSGGKTIQDILSTKNKLNDINERMLDQAQAEVDRDNFDSSHIYIKTDGENLPTNNMLDYVFNGDGIPPNQNEVVDSGTRFPQSPQEGEYFLRTDYSPHRLFRRVNNLWKAIEDNWREQYQPARRTLEQFMDNDEQIEFGPRPEETQPSKQAITKVVPPKTKIPAPNEDCGNDQDEDEE